jgi:hypothetical protein
VLPGRGCDCKLRRRLPTAPIERCRAHRRRKPPPPLAPAGVGRLTGLTARPLPRAGPREPWRGPAGGRAFSFRRIWVPAGCRSLSWYSLAVPGGPFRRPSLRPATRSSESPCCGVLPPTRFPRTQCLPHSTRPHALRVDLAGALGHSFPRPIPLGPTRLGLIGPELWLVHPWVGRKVPGLHPGFHSAPRT